LLSFVQIDGSPLMCMILTLLPAVTFQLVDRVMKEDLAEVHSKKRRPKKDGKRHGYFEEVIFSVADWQALRDLLDILTVSTSFQFLLNMIFISLNEFSSLFHFFRSY
jgi:hypothetical protein